MPPQQYSDKRMRKNTVQVQVGKIKIGGGIGKTTPAPVAIQSMTNTPTANVQATFKQICELIDAGSELVRITVNDLAAAQAVPKIKARLLKAGAPYSQTPIIGDFHYNGHTLLTNVPECAKALDKYRINPGNIGTKEAHDYNFKTMIECAIKYNKPVRIGVNWGSLDQELFTSLMDKNGHTKTPKSDKEILYEAVVQSALNSANQAIKIGLPKNKIILSAKMSIVQDMIKVYQMLSSRTDLPLHLGLTEAGSNDQGIVASVAALSVLMQAGIGDTIRVSITPTPGAPRAREVEICKYILQTMGIRHFRPMVTSCPGCGRTSSDFFQKLAAQVNAHIAKKMSQWKAKYPGVESLQIAVMGCIVNGPGESKHADIGISLPGKTEQPIAPVYIEGKQFTILKGQKIPQQFIKILEEYIQKRFSR